MALTLSAIRGMNDILPDQTPIWQWVESQLRTIVQSYGYQEIRFPLLEHTELFERVIGEVTDIVEKEMYTFKDRNGDSLTLRPEGTASCVRAGIEHQLFYHQTPKLWYLGPIFRHERPQKGRYRQFYQLGVETFGLSGPEIDIEMILMATRAWKTLGILEAVTLQLNSLGSKETRAKYRTSLVDYFKKYERDLDEDSQRRLMTNPLRILDSKEPKMQSIIAEAPTLLTYLDDESRVHFHTVCEGLTKAGVSYQINPRLVRGLDYYSRTVFEWVTDRLGAQGAVCAGGRFDGLVEQMGGTPTPAIGFALGMERLIALLAELKQIPAHLAPVDIYAMVGEGVDKSAVLLQIERLREKMPHLRILIDHAGGSFKSQFKRADKSGARFALIVGESEQTSQKMTLKHLREEKPQMTLAEAEVIHFFSR